MLLRSFEGLVYPKYCLFCKDIVEEDYVCSDCLSNLQFIDEEQCIVCGDINDPYHQFKGCHHKLKHIPWSYRAAAFHYTGEVKKMVQELKFNSATQYLPFAGRAMAKRLTQGSVPKFDFIVPVPLHIAREINRSYNQAYLLAEELSSNTDVPLVNALRRSKYTKPQSNLMKQQRQSNLDGVFKVFPTFVNRLKGKRVLVIDDVCTSGATLRACCKTLLENGVGQCGVLTLAQR